MSLKITRRHFLQAAGGVTFLALVPVGRGLFAMRGAKDAPFFTAEPYIQPGPHSRLVEGQEGAVLAWQTRAKAANFEVEFGATQRLGRKAAVERVERPAADGGSVFNYHAPLNGLRLNTRHFYRIKCNGAVLAEGFWTSRKARGHKMRFVAFGDNSCGSSNDHAIAFQAYRARPDFVMNTGDNVYDGGLDSEYQQFFFPIYNAAQATPQTGAPLLRSVPFYSVLANHDVHRRDAEKRPCADFDREPDALAFYTALHLPLNGPAPAQPTLTAGAAGRSEAFRRSAGARFPRMANYSFDYGDAHFVCLDSNLYVDPSDAGLQKWIAADLAGTDAAWKFVVYHHPAFNAGREHYREQQMRVLSPLFEKHDVDFVLSGHEHNYQRTRPLRFSPAGPGRAKRLHQGDRRVPGAFAVDGGFDGKDQTRPDGIVYITTGAGGNRLYDLDMNNNPPSWRHADDGNSDYVARFHSNRHSLSVFDVEASRLWLTQLDAVGKIIDRVLVSKA